MILQRDGNQFHLQSVLFFIKSRTSFYHAMENCESSFENIFP